MIKKRFIPHSILAPYIDSIWISAKANRDIQANLLPGTGSEMYFLMDGAFAKENRRQDRIQFISLRNKSIVLALPKDTFLIAVRFKFSSIRHFCNIPLSELFDQLIPADEIWGNEISQTKTLLAKHQSIDQWLNIIEDFLIKQLALNQKPIYIKPSEIRSIYEIPNERTIFEIARDNCLSIRQFEKQFLKQMGIPAKKFQSLSRFQKVVKSCLVNKNSNYLPIALEFGYYDQAHFIKDFRRKTQTTPVAFLCDTNFSTHFYNTSPSGGNTFAS
jgi:Transcriptional regulator containing an amidase domain and an AraC-type DNA-binding HTH domain